MGLCVVYIQPPVQNVLGIINAIPPQVLTELVAGQRSDAVVVTAALAAQIASIRVADTLLDIRTPVPLQQGQIVQVELAQSAGKPVLKLILPTDLIPATRVAVVAPLVLNPGQQLAVEVIKLVGENRLIVETKSSPLVAAQTKITSQQFDIDISKLTKNFTVGEKVLVEIISTKPLTVELKAQSQLREQLIVERIKQLLPQQTIKPNLTAISQALKTVSLASSVRSEVQNLLTNILDKQSVNRPQALQQAIQKSGSFTEKQLLQQSSLINQDFKVNLLKVLSSLESELSKNHKATVVEGKNQTSIPLQNPGKTVSRPGFLTNFVTKQTVADSQSKLTSQISDNKVVSSNTSTISKGISSSGQPKDIRPAYLNQSQTQSIQNQTKSAELSSAQRGIETLQMPASRTTQKAESNIVKPLLQAKPSAEPAAAKLPLARLAPLSSLVLASATYRTNPASVSVLTSPPTTSLPTTFTPLLGSVLTSPVQAMALAKVMSQSMSSEQLRGLQLEIGVLQNLLREVEGLHARLQLNQFSMLKEPDSPSAPLASWIFDLPLKDRQDVDLLQLQIDQYKDDADEEEDDNIWNVQLRLDTQNLGPVQATVTLHAEDIKIILRAERPESAELLEQHLAFLHDALANLGVSISHVSCVCGEVSKAILAEQYISESNSIVDISI